MKKELELYVHIPFCVKKCAYCDFLSFSAKQEEVSAYVEALAEEIKRTVFGLLRDNDFFRRWNSFYIRGSIHCLYFSCFAGKFRYCGECGNNDGSKSRNCVGRKDKHVENMRSEPVKYRSSIGR